MQSEIMLFHQCGFRTNWNIESFNDDGTGDFIVFSPRDLKYDKLMEYSSNFLNKCVFDPQYYMPNCTHKNLLSYDFYPGAIIDNDKYETNLFIDKSYEAAEKCIEFQISNKFKYVIVPSLYPTVEYDEFLYKNYDLIYKPFTNVIRSKSIDKKILLTSIITSNILKSEDKITKVLNELTKYPEIDGIYLIPDIQRTTKRIKDIDIIFNLLKIIDCLKMSDLEVHIAYVDIEGFILSLAFPNSLSFGSYENTRKFKTIKFKDEKEKGNQQPNARFYSSKLLQWIDTRYLDSMQQLYAYTDALFDNNIYKDMMIRTEYNWHFQKPEPYKHFFISYCDQIKSLARDYEMRYNDISNAIKQAIKLFAELDSLGIIFDSDTNGDHLPIWLTAINRYVNYKKK